MVYDNVCFAQSTVSSSSESIMSLQLEKERMNFMLEKMLFKFQKLYTAIKRTLRNKKVSTYELVTHLECMGSLKPVYGEIDNPPLRCELPRLARAESSDAIMSIVSKYCSIISYNLLEHIIDEFGTKQDKESMASYIKEFTEYAKCFIVQCPSKVEKMCEEGDANLFVMLDDSFNEYTLGHLNLFIGNLRKTLRIPPTIALRLCRMDSKNSCK